MGRQPGFVPVGKAVWNGVEIYGGEWYDETNRTVKRLLWRHVCVNYKLILRLIGNVLAMEAICMLPPVVVSIIYGGEDLPAFLISIAVIAAAAVPLMRMKPVDKRFRNVEGFVAAALSWLALSVAGALPFMLCGHFASIADCLFESISGFTTTGVTTLGSATALPRGIMFWMSITHWLGGMGVLVFVLAILPSTGASAVNLLRAEGSGPSPGKIVPRIRKTAEILYMIYIVLTLVQIPLLCLAGLPLYDAMIHAFGTAGTGGFSNMRASVGAYDNAAAEAIITVFMLLFGINFTLYFHLIRKEAKLFAKDAELRFYLCVVALSIVFIMLNIRPLYAGWGAAFRDSSFQVASFATSTGYFTTDFNLWPSASKAVLVMLMIVGASAGSTSGGIKMIRVVTIVKAIRMELSKVVHPRLVKTLRVNDKVVEDDMLLKSCLFVLAYLLIAIASVILISFDGKDLVTNVTAVIGALSNVGVGLGEIGPQSTYAVFSPFSRMVLSFCMLAGRLEIYPVLILFVPSIWRRGSLN